MNLFDFLKSLYEGAFLWGQRRIAQQQAAHGLTENLEAVDQAATAAAETIDLANKLAADNDPHKQRLAALIKDHVEGGIKQVLMCQLPVEEVRAIEPDHPFFENSEPSRASLPGTPKRLPTPKPLPHTPPPLPAPTAKRGRDLLDGRRQGRSHRGHAPPSQSLVLRRSTHALALAQPSGKT